MADNTLLNAGTGGDTISTDDVGGGVKVQRVKVQYGADGSAADVDNAGNGLPVIASGRTAIIAASAFTRPADTTAYAAGDLVANSTTAGSVTVITFTNAARIAAGSGAVRRARLRKSGTGIVNASFRLHLYTASPTLANGDNGVFSTSQAATYLGALDITVDQAFTDGAFGVGLPRIGSEINFKLASGQNLIGLLEARNTYTPVSAETFTLELEILQD
jgi:hypothetical protein